MSENKRLIKNTGLIAIGSFGAKAMSFLLLPLYTSILTTEEYGTYDFIVAICAFLFPIVTLSMNEAMFRFIIASDGDKSKFKIAVSQAFFLEVVGIIVLGIVAIGTSFFYNPTNCMYIWLYVSANALYAFSTYLLRGMGKTKIYTLVSLLKTFLQLSVNVVTIAVLYWGLKGLLLSLCFSEIVAFAVVFFPNKLWKYISIKNVSKNSTKEMLDYSLPLVPNTLCSQIINLSDRVVISSFLGTAANGIYAISYKFPNMLETMYHYFYLAWSESASRVVEKSKEEAEKYYQRLYNSLDCMIYSIVLCMVSGMPILYRIFVKGHGYVDGFDYVTILTFAMYFNCIAKYYSGIYTALKKTKLLATSTVIGAVINVAINVSFIKYVGLWAAALSTLIAECVVVFIRRYKLKRHIHIKLSVKSTIGKIVMAGVVFLLYDYSNWYKIVASIVISCTYAIIVNRDVIKKIMLILNSKVKKDRP